MLMVKLYLTRRVYVHIFIFQNGAIRELGILENGLAEGIWKYYRKNGKLWKIGNFSSGIKVGL